MLELGRRQRRIEVVGHSHPSPPLTENASSARLQRDDSCHGFAGAREQDFLTLLCLLDELGECGLGFVHVHDLHSHHSS